MKLWYVTDGMISIMYFLPPQVVVGGCTSRMHQQDIHELLCHHSKGVLAARGDSCSWSLHPVYLISKSSHVQMTNLSTCKSCSNNGSKIDILDCSLHGYLRADTGCRHDSTRSTSFRTTLPPEDANCCLQCISWKVIQKTKHYIMFNEKTLANLLRKP